MSTSYAYDSNNIGHKYINSPQLDEDLERVAEEMRDSKE